MTQVTTSGSKVSTGPKFDMRRAAAPVKAPAPIGVDDGHYAIKACAGAEAFFTLPARSYPGKLQISEISGSSNDDLVYETADGEFVTITAEHALAPAVDTRQNGYPTSSPNRALVAHALRKMGICDPASIVTGLPVNKFYEGGNRNDELIEAKRQSLLRPVKDASGNVVVQIVRHQVISEAVAAYYDALLDFNGGYNLDFKEIADEEPIAVVDAGGKTLDIATVKEGGQGLYQELSGTAETGALFLYDMLESALRERFDIKDNIPFPKLQRAITSGEYRLYGKRHDVQALVQQQLSDFAERVRFEVTKLLGDGSRFGGVLFVGGGANLLHNHLDQIFPGLPREAITIAPLGNDPRTDSSFANARGMYKAALLDSLSQ